MTVHPGWPAFFPGQPEYAEARTGKDGRYKMFVHLRRRQPMDFLLPRDFQVMSCIMARDLARNLAARRDFIRLPTNIDLNLEPGITLSGLVVDTKGTPVTNAMVDLSFSSFHLGQRPLKVDAQGSFSIPALPQRQDYSFSDGISAQGYGSADQSLQAKDTHTNHYVFPTFVLKTADRKLAGQVVDSDNKPLPGVQVGFRGGPGQPRKVASTRTDGEGRFAFDDLSEGSVTVFAELWGPPGRGRRPGTTQMRVQAGDTNLLLQLRPPEPRSK